MLEQQYQKMQWWHKEEQQLQTYLKEVAKTYHIEWAAQKAWKVAKTKVWEKAKKQKITE